VSPSTLQSASTTRLTLHTGLSSQAIIFMHGPALTGKTTIAGYLGQRLDVVVRSTYRNGRVLTRGQIDEAKREVRYQRLFREAEQILRGGNSVILDGRFSEPARRKQVYALAREYFAHVIVVRTSCDSRAVIRKRIKRRRADPTAPDHEAATMAIYESTVRNVQTHPIQHDPEFWALGVEVVEFRTGKSPSIFCAPGAHADARLIASILDESRLLASSRARAARVPGRPAGAAT
jgi:predicted kinase